MTTHTAEEPVPGDDMPDGTEPDEAGTGESHAVDDAAAGDPPAATNADAQATTEADAQAGGEAKPAPFYSRVEDFVDGHFVPLISRPLGGEFRWCAQWWRHAEAISRLTAVWHAWEALRLQTGTGIGIWYRDHLDHQLPMLLGARGPFFQCSPEEHIEPGRLRTEPAPPGWWT